MTRRDFLAIIDKRLSSLPSVERNEILADFNEHFDTALAQGKTEKEVCIALGDPMDIAKQYMGEVIVEKQPKKNAGYIVIVFLGLLLLDAILVIPIIASLFSVIIALWAVLLALAITTVVLIIVSLISLIPTIGLTFLTSLGVCFGGVSLGAFTVLGSMGMFYLTKWFLKVCLAYLKVHSKVLQGEF